MRNVFVHLVAGSGKLAVTNRMKQMKATLRILILFIGLSISLFLYLCFFEIHTLNLTSKATGENIKAIKVGMSIDQVIAILGRPYHINTDCGRGHNISCKNPKDYLDDDIIDKDDLNLIVANYFKDTTYCCDVYKNDTKGFDLRFSKIVPIATCTTVYVGFDSTFKVDLVHVSRKYGFFDNNTNNPPIYHLSTYENSNGKSIKVKPWIYIDQKSFDKTFN